MIRIGTDKKRSKQTRMDYSRLEQSSTHPEYIVVGQNRLEQTRINYVEQIGRQTADSFIDRQKDRQTDRQIDTQIDRQTDRQTDRYLDTYIPRYIDTQIDRYRDTYTQIHKYLDTQIPRKRQMDGGMQIQMVCNSCRALQRTSSARRPNSNWIMKISARPEAQKIRNP